MASVFMDDKALIDGVAEKNHNLSHRNMSQEAIVLEFAQPSMLTYTADQASWPTEMLVALGADSDLSRMMQGLLQDLVPHLQSTKITSSAVTIVTVLLAANERVFCVENPKTEAGKEQKLKLQIASVSFTFCRGSSSHLQLDGLSKSLLEPGEFSLMIFPTGSKAACMTVNKSKNLYGHIEGEKLCVTSVTDWDQLFADIPRAQQQEELPSAPLVEDVRPKAAQPPKPPAAPEAEPSTLPERRHSMIEEVRPTEYKTLCEEDLRAIDKFFRSDLPGLACPDFSGQTALLGIA